MKKKKIIAVALLLVNFVFLPGCWNYREIETLSIVAGLSIDSGKVGSKYHITFDTVDITQGKEKPEQSKLIETEGDSIFDAAREAIRLSGKRLYFGDCKVAIVSNQISSSGISPALDWLSRDHELRNDLNVYISKMNTAQDVLKNKGMTSPINSNEIEEDLANNRELLSKAPFIPLYQVNNLLSSKGIELVLPTLNTTGSMGNVTTELDGTALFKEDKLIGYLDNNENKEFLFITNKVKGGMYLVKKESSTPDLNLEIKRNKTSLKPVYTGDKPRIKISVQMLCSLDEVLTKADYGTNDAIKAVEKKAGEQMEVELKQLISKVQKEYGSDIFGFGNLIYKDNYVYWKKIEPDWDEIFKSLAVDVTAKVKIQDTGIKYSKLKVGDKS